MDKGNSGNENGSSGGKELQRSGKQVGSRSAVGSNQSKSRKRTKKSKVVMDQRSQQQLKITRNAFNEIRFYQNTTQVLIPRRNFSRLVREIVAKHDATYRMRVEALEALQEAAESFLIHYLSDSSLCTAHAKRVTLMREDMRLVRNLKHNDMFVATEI